MFLHSIIFYHIFNSIDSERCCKEIVERVINIVAKKRSTMNQKSRKKLAKEIVVTHQTPKYDHRDHQPPGFRELAAQSLDQIEETKELAMEREHEGEKDLNMQNSEVEEYKEVAYETLRYLEKNEIIMLTDILRMSNCYTVDFSVYDIKEQDLYNEFQCFTTSLIDPEKRKHHRLDMKNEMKEEGDFRERISSFGYGGGSLNLRSQGSIGGDCLLNVIKHQPRKVKEWFIHLNAGRPIKDVLQLWTRDMDPRESKDSRILVYYLWLFGHYKKLIKRLYEVPIFKPLTLMNQPSLMHTVTPPSPPETAFKGYRHLERAHSIGYKDDLQKLKPIFTTADPGEDPNKDAITIRLRSKEKGKPEQNYEILMKEFDLKHIYMQY